MSVAEPIDPDEPVAYFIEQMKSSGKATKTINNYETALYYHLATFLNKRGMDYGEMTRYDCEDFLRHLDNNTEILPNVRRKYSNDIKKFYAYYNTRGEFETNPMKLAMETFDFGSSPENAKREIKIGEMIQFIDSIKHPLTLVIVLTLLKTAIRVGELCNLDLRDLNIDHPRIREIYPSHRSELDGKPNSIFIEQNIKMRAGSITNGEMREESNKRKRSTIIPIDDELKKAMVLWLALRPESRSPAEPLFTRVDASRNHQSGDRLKADTAYRLITDETKKHGWWELGAGVSTNVTPHYFRHFWTTRMRNRTKDDVFIRFIRGDMGEEPMDDYTHNWGDKVRQTYYSNIYKLF